jgi:hypothetical protein
VRSDEAHAREEEEERSMLSPSLLALNNFMLGFPYYYLLF